MINYEAATKALWTDKGWSLCKRRNRVEALARKVVDAALGDEPLYVYVGPANDRHLFERQAQGLVERVWPEVDDE